MQCKIVQVENRMLQNESHLEENILDKSRLNLSFR